MRRRTRRGQATIEFALVFGAGFLVGVVRVGWLAPEIGERPAELLELPLMLAVAWLAARWSVRRLGVPRATLRPPRES